jgi:hypothetical protein
MATSTSGVYYPPNNQLEVFYVDANGALCLVWKAQNGAWNPPFKLTADGFAAPRAPVAAVYYPPNDQLEVFVVNVDGALNVVYKAQNGAWNPPFALTQGQFARQITPLVAVYYPPNDQLEVLLFDNKGIFSVVYKAQNGAWNPPVGLTAADEALVGTPVSAVYYPPNDQLEAFFVDSTGAFNVIWKAHNRLWNQPVALTRAGYALQRSPLSAVYYPLNDQLEVFLIDGNGALSLMWKANNGAWNDPYSITPSAWATPGKPVIAVYYPLNNQLEALVADTRGSLSVAWKVNNGPWNRPVGITLPGFLGDGTTWAGVHYPLDDHLEVFTANPLDVVFVDWKVNNGPWAPCPFPLSPWRFPPGPPAPATVVEVARIAQLTGDRDPEDPNRPILNPTGAWGVPGVDLGASTEHDGRLFFFFGDVPRMGRTEGPEQDGDLVAFTSDTEVGPAGIRLQPTLSGPYFEQYTVEPPFTNATFTNRTPTGAFSFGGRAYVFAVVDDVDAPDPTKALPLSILTSKEHPDLPGTYQVEFQFDNFRFWQVAPIVVDNAAIDSLPLPNGPGLIMYGGGQPGSIQLGWLPLPITPQGRGAPSGIRYYTGSGWSTKADDAKILVPLPDGYTSVSAAWITGANLWVLVYSNARPADYSTYYSSVHPDLLRLPFALTGSVVARIGPTPWQLSDEIEIFNPCRDGAYTRYMHWTGFDSIVPNVPPNLGDDQAWAYGAFLVNRFCYWEPDSRTLTLHYLMSPSRPYQVQLMRTRLQIP